MATLGVPGLEGLDEDVVEVAKGGETHEWMNFDQRKLYTNAFIVQDGKILLGYKKRGFGVNKYNGFGGKVDPGETLAQAAARELQEEAGIEAPLQHAGTFLFLITGVQWAFQIEIYRADTYTGVPTETEEMRPQWFRVDDCGNHSDLPPIPYDKLWESDHLWLPLLLERRHFVARTDFIRQGETDVLQKWWFGATVAGSSTKS